MPRTVERWLETFMCKQYADLFEAYGFKTLHQVCQLQPATVQQMGIPPEHCDKILENVSVLRQSTVGTVVSNFSEQNYDHQLANHGQSNNSYSYHSPPSYPTPHQYGNHNGQINHNVSYQTGEGYPAQQRYRTSNQDVYGQSMYNNHLHPNHGSWDETMRLYNHSPRHVIGNSPPPHSPMMRSPPPLSPSAAMAIPSHYPHHVIMDQLPAANHHAWTSSQVMSPSMVNSPRGTPSPGMGHPSNLSSPAMAACSPAHAKPFSPPPYSPHPPPAHQQAVGYDYPPSQTSSPLGTAPNRLLPSPGVNHSSSDPLQSLQKMVLLDSQNIRTGALPPADVTGSSSPAKCKSKLALSEPLGECETPSPCSNMFEKSKRVISNSAEASSAESTDSSSMSTTPPPTDAPSSTIVPTSDSESAQFGPISANARNTATSDFEVTEDSLASDHRSPGLAIAGCKLRNKESNPVKDFNADARIEEVSGSSVKSCREVKTKARKTHENPNDVFHESCTSPRPSLLRPVRAAEATNLMTENVHHSPTNPTQKHVTGARTQCAVDAESSAEPSDDDFLRANKNLRKKQNSWEGPELTSKSLKQLNNHPSSKVNGDKLGNWNLDLSPDVTFVARKMRGGEAVVGSFEIVNNCSQVQEDASPARKRRTSVADRGEGTPTKGSQHSPRRSERLHSLSSEVDSTCTSVSKMDSNSSCHSEQHSSDLDTKMDVSPGKPKEPLNGKIPFAENGGPSLNTQTMSVVPTIKSHCDTLRTDKAISSSALEHSVPGPRKRGRPLGSKNRPRDGTSEEAEAKKSKKKKCNKDCDAESEAISKKQKPPVTVCENVVAIRKNGTEGKLKGPFLHFETTMERLVNVIVVNTPVRDEEGEAKGIKKRVTQNSEGTRARNKILTVGFNSTLSANYDVFTKDKSWVCSLCHKGSHHKGLGDLFGPYFEDNVCQTPTNSDNVGLEESAEKEDLCNQSPSRRVREKRKRSELVEEFFKLTMAKKGKRVQEASKISSPEIIPSSESSPKPSDRESNHKSGSSFMAKTKEFWVHEDCIVWCHGVYLLGQRIIGIKEAIAAAAAVICSKCLEGGATLGCLRKGCKEHYHYLCAIEAGCILEEEAFSLLCANHKQGRITST